MINIEDEVKKSHKAIQYLKYKKLIKKKGSYIFDFVELKYRNNQAKLENEIKEVNNI